MSQVCSQSQRLPDTCPISQNECSQVSNESQNRQEPWGRLVPARPEFKLLEMYKDEYSVGRGDNCDITVNTSPPEKPYLTQAISKIHFKIRRVKVAANLDEFVVHLDDLSSNGTYVNRNLVGKGNSVILENYSDIAMCFSSCRAFLYTSLLSDPEVGAYPDEVRNQFTISRVLGTGAFGQVRLVYDKNTGEPFAMKVIKKKLTGNDPVTLYEKVRLQREVDVLKTLSHTCIIKFKNMINTPNAMFIITEFVKGGELLDRLKNGPLDENDAKLYFFQLAMAVNYLHLNGVIHRDIKLENILLSSTSSDCLIKLSDFGFSKFLTDESVFMSYCGTPMYIAPEILKTRGKPATYDNKVDVWSMGVVLYICLSAVMPFVATPKRTLADQVLSGTYDFGHSNWQRVSHKARFLVKKMLTTKPWLRISSDDILNHEWLKDKSIRMRYNRLVNVSLRERFGGSRSSDSELDSDTENYRVKRIKI